ncbi:MAG: zinc-finger domain-containing protein [Burkholderiaceae bacterium]|jgi:uncharacterized Zn-finger protein|nr:zinc-finger domain-containing protein [Burkholderiaceae bacterium]
MKQAVIELAASDLNPEGGVYCPNPKAGMQLWNAHPKVYLDVAHAGMAKCPYCGTEYRLKAGETVQAGH